MYTLLNVSKFLYELRYLVLLVRLICFLIYSILVNSPVSLLAKKFTKSYWAFTISHCVKSVQIGSFFRSVFSSIRTGYGDLLLRKSPYSVRMLENTDQKKLRILDTFHAVSITPRFSPGVLQISPLPPGSLVWDNLQDFEINFIVK